MSIAHRLLTDQDIHNIVRNFALPRPHPSQLCTERVAQQIMFKGRVSTGSGELMDMVICCVDGIGLELQAVLTAPKKTKPSIHCVS